MFVRMVKWRSRIPWNERQKTIVYGPDCVTISLSRIIVSSEYFFSSHLDMYKSVFVKISIYFAVCLVSWHSLSNLLGTIIPDPSLATKREAPCLVHQSSLIPSICNVHL